MKKGNPSVGDMVLDGKYRLEETIGSGGMGQVFKATHTEIGRDVAIKYLRGKHIDNPELIKRFQQEARLAGSIGHDNICEVTDLGTDEGGVHYLVMPFLNGDSLDKFLGQSDKLSLGRMIDMMCQTLSALEAAHNNRIVHRDLKPNNIFVTQVGDRKDFIKLLDFGISKVLDKNAISELTQSGIALGTPYYMAPEMAQGAREIDYRVDIYAAGVILYEALTGTRPFEGASYNEVMFKIVAEQFPMPTSVNPLIPAAVEAVIVKAMARNREIRFSTAEEMLHALERCPTEFLETPRADALSASTTVADAIKPFDIPTQDDDSSTKDKRRSQMKLVLFAVLMIVALGTAFFLWPTRDQSERPVPVVTPEPEPSKKEEPKDEQPVPPVEVSAPVPAPVVSSPQNAEVVKKVSKKKSPKPAEETPTSNDDPNTVDGRMGTIIVTEF